MHTHSFSNADEVAQAVAQQVQEACKNAIDEHGSFHLILAGGSTPKHCYELLVPMPLYWQKVHIYFGDERCLPSGDTERNDTMAYAALLNHVPIPSSQVYVIPAQMGAEDGAARYCTLLEKAPIADMLLLGIGEDGHTASLFPGNQALDDTCLAVPVFNSPKPPSERVSMGLSILNQARKKIIMVTGANKQPVWQAIKGGESFPVTKIKDATWFLDAAAEGK
ncbi:MAG: 6-phosphogluconolactonase [Mariprofundaceae bacterium]